MELHHKMTVRRLPTIRAGEHVRLPAACRQGAMESNSSTQSTRPWAPPISSCRSPIRADGLVGTDT